MALSTTQYGYIFDPMVTFTDDKGKTIKNGFVRVFVAGSSTPVVTYRNFDGAANQDLIELDNSGRTKTSVIGSKGITYKVCVYDAFHSQESPILTVDKVSAIGANITAGAGATVVTGLDGLTTKPDGFVDASVVGTDGYVALDHTLVTDDLNTDAKVTAVENDRYIPLLNEDVNDPDSKMTLGRLWQWVLGKIKSLSTTITAFRTGDVIAVDGPSGTAKMSKDDLLKGTAENTADKELYLGIGSTSGKYKFTKSEFHKMEAYERLLNNVYPTVYKGFRFYFDGSADNLTCNLLAYDRDTDTYSSIVSASQKITYEFDRDIEALAILLEKSDSSPITMDDYNEDYITLSNGLLERITDQKIDGFDDVFFGLVEHSDQVFDASKATLHGYWNASGTITQNAAFSSAYFRVQPDTDVYTRYAFTYSAWFDKDFNWISSNINSAADATLHSPVNAYYMCIGTATSIIDKLFVSFKPSDRCTWNTEPKFVAKNIEGVTEYDYYDLPFVRNGKVCCNGGKDSDTAYYAGVVVGESYNICRVKWLWETRPSANNYGSIALINSSNKCDRIPDIVDLSLHLVITSTYFVLDVLGKRYGTQQYQRFLNITFDTPLDTSVEHDAYMVTAGNSVIVNIDGTNYTGTFTPDANITSLADVVGKSVVFEHYCIGGNRALFNMPQFTFFEIKNGAKTIVQDKFRRESGVLSVTPQGHPYMVYSNVNGIGI